MIYSARIILSCPRGTKPERTNEVLRLLREATRDCLRDGAVSIELEAWAVEKLTEELTSSPTCPEAGRGGGFPSSRQGFSASSPAAPTSGEDDD